MDAGTGFTAQVYELSHVFLHKVCAVVSHTACLIAFHGVLYATVRVAF